MPGLRELVDSSATLRDCAAWKRLETHAEAMRPAHLGDLLDQPDRFSRFSLEIDGLVLDYSRNMVTGETLELLLQLAAERHLKDWTRLLLDGAPVNTTEVRPALHTALRRSAERPLLVSGQDVMPAVEAERDRVMAFAEAVRSGDRRGATGRQFTDVVNIGIGGSDLGLAMAARALRRFAHPGIAGHFVSNIDGSGLADVLDRLDPETTLFVVCSKSFTTLETHLNAEAARAWFLESQPEAALGQHFAAISVNDEAMNRFGIGADMRFAMWDWVGGRYSVWSAVGLALAILLGERRFREFLAGAAAMDEHFETAAADASLPVLLGLLGVWNQNFLGVTSHVVLPYDDRLALLPAFLQQLDMESNGKRTTRAGTPVDTSTGTVIWGQPGSNAQHSFFQLLHQGTANVSLDFVAPVRASSRFGDAHRQGLANMLAQAEAFARGYPEADVRRDMAAGGITGEALDRLAPHRTHPGNRPGNILLVPELTPAALGRLIALYEHKVFVQSVIWGINPFDQWGVELGKAMASGMSDALGGEGEAGALPEIAEVIRRWSLD